jgi:hypothetical protein
MDDFFIGWQDRAPAAYARRSRTFVYALFVAIPLLAGLIVFSQRGFLPSVFEFGQTTELEGVLALRPVPMLKIRNGDGVQSLLLVGKGKHGAEETLEALAKTQANALDGRSIRLRGTLIYHDGKGLLELADLEEAFAGFGAKATHQVAVESLGAVVLRGEIADPKCFFGVMKPGEGKPHRSCAIRCIAGGIPPVLKVADKNGNSAYYLLKGTNGEDIHAQVLDYVADDIRVCGVLEKTDDWYVLKIDPAHKIKRIRPHWMGKNEPLCGE